MKTRNILLPLFGILLLIFYSCNNNSEKKSTLETDCEQELKKVKKEIIEIKHDLDLKFDYDESIKWEFCKETQAATPKRNYNTRLGITKFTIPIPKGSHLKLKTKQSNLLEYECTGEIFNGDLILHNITETGMSREKGDSLQIIVRFKGFKESICNDFNSGEKKSIIQGEPLWLAK